MLVARRGGVYAAQAALLLEGEGVGIECGGLLGGSGGLLLYDMGDGSAVEREPFAR